MKYEILKFYTDSARVLVKYTDDQSGRSMEATLELPLHAEGGAYTDKEIDDFLNLHAPTAIFEYETSRAALKAKYDFSQVTVLPPEPVAPVITEFQKADAEARMTRSRLLYQSDWTQSKDFPAGAAKQAAWAGYRQSLRDMTKQSGYPMNIVWPVPPVN